MRRYDGGDAPASPFLDIVETMTPLEGALIYVHHGWEVLPIVPGTQRSYIPWSDGGLRTSEEVRTAWEVHPDAQVAIITGARTGIVVADCDGDQGIENFRRLVANDDEFFSILQVSTPSGGRHFYFTHPGEGRVVPCSVSKLAPGVDVRGDGGYVVAPPSRC